MTSTFRKTVLLLLSLVMLFSLTAAAAFAEKQESAVGYVESTWVEAYPTDRSENNTELLNTYAQEQLDKASGSGVSAANTFYAYNELNAEYPTMGKLYMAILPEIQAIAAGQRTSTVISGSLGDLGVRLEYTAAELGYNSITSDNIGDAFAKAMRLAGLTAENTQPTELMVDALLADCAYELYWFDKSNKTGGYSYNYGGCTSSGDTLTLNGDYTLMFKVSSEYAPTGGDGYTVSAEYANTINNAISTAQWIVQDAANRADWSKLNFYRQQICTLTEYNNDAADDKTDTPYGNPWQLIWVFDNDPSTTVVCEGYAKAFAYLCELTNAQNGFEKDIQCYLVSGQMAGGEGAGPHMWNVVRLDGRNYLVDVTNCDDGTIGAPAQLFMVGYDSVDTAGVYDFACEGGNIRYQYDNDSISTYGTEKLNLVSKAEITAPTDGRTVTLTVNGNTETATARAYETVTMWIRAPGATGLRIWNQSEKKWAYYDGYNSLKYLEHRDRYAPGEWSLFAQACYNDYSGWIEEPGEAQWTTLSNEVLLTVPTPTESCPAPNVTLNGTVSPVSVNRGDWIHVVITDPAGVEVRRQLKIMKKIDDANHYQEMEGEYFYFDTDNEGYIQAARFAPGDYALLVSVAAAGYNKNEIYRLFTVTDEAPTAGLKVSNDSLSCLRHIMVRGYVPGAYRMQLKATREDDPYWIQSRELWAELSMFPLRFEEPGEYTLTLSAWSENDELLGTYTAVVTVTAMETAMLKTPDLSAFPRILRSGEGFSGTIGLDERAANLGIEISFYPDDGERQNIYSSNRDSSDGEDWTTVELPAELFTQAGRYELTVYNYGSDIMSSDTTLSILREKDDAPAGDLVLTANGSMVNIDSWNSWKSISVEVSSQSATAVRILGGNNWDYADMSGGSVTRDYCLGDGDYTLVAQMTTDDPVWRGDEEYWYTHSWEELNWTSLSNVVTLHVSSPNGQLAKPQLTMTPADGEVTQGEPLTVTAASQAVQGQTAREWIRAKLMRLEGLDSDYPYWISEGEYGDGTLQALIPTRNLTPGVYRLKVMMSAEGWLSNENYVTFTVLPKTAETVSDGSSFSFITLDEGIFEGQYSGSKLITPAESGAYTFTLSFEGNPTVQQDQAYLGIVGTDIQDRSFDTGVPASMMFTTMLSAGEEYELVLSNLEALGTLNVNVAVNYGIIPYDNTLVLPASVKEIGEEAFAGASAQRIDLPAGIESIGSRAFADSDSLCFVVILNVSVQIDSTAFQNSPYVRIAAPDGGTVKAFAINAGIPFIPLPTAPQS